MKFVCQVIRPSRAGPAPPACAIGRVICGKATRRQASQVTQHHRFDSTSEMLTTALCADTHTCLNMRVEGGVGFGGLSSGRYPAFGQHTSPRRLPPVTRPFHSLITDSRQHGDANLLAHES